MPLMPPVVKILIISNVAMFYIQNLYGMPLIEALALWPLPSGLNALVGADQPRFHLLQLFTYAFLHGNLLHLFFNMYALWLFGSRLENTWGSKKFALYYCICVVGAGLIQLLVTSSAGGEAYPTVGASGGVYGLLLAFGLIFPDEILILMFPPIALRAKWFVFLYGGIELWAGITGTAAGIAHFAHLGGMLFGYLTLRYWRQR